MSAKPSLEAEAKAMAEHIAFLEKLNDEAMDLKDQLVRALKAHPTVYTSGDEYRALSAWLEMVDALIARAEGRHG